MSVETIHNSLEIDDMFNKLGLENNNLNIKKSEKCRLIRNANYDLNYSRLYPESYKSIIYTDTPMLCMRMKQLDQKEQTELWKSDDYVADEKIDGLRCYLAYNKDYDKNNGYEIFSRENDELTLLPKVITSQFSTIINRPDKFYQAFLLDCELAIDKNLNPKLYIFDCLCFNNNYTTEEQWQYRRYITEKIVESINSVNVCLTQYQKTNKMDFYNYIKSNGGEGVVIKNTQSKYSTKGTRSKYGWTKVKGNVFDYSIIEDTLEGYVLETPCLTSKTLPLFGFINNDEISKKITEIPVEMISLLNTHSISNYQITTGSVIEFSSSFFSYKEKMFKNSFPVKIRIDKTIKDCSYSNNDLVRWSS